MREILFKAKRVKDGEWIEGYLFDNGFDGEEKKYFIGGLIIEKYNGTACDEWVITGIDFCEINPETICQFTGLCDKNGKKIWENDICDRKEKYPEVVKMTNGDWTLDYSYAIGRDYGNSYCNLGFYVNERKCVEVIGNIFDNPELLQEESNE
ncbi:MAG: hypothetical protein EGR94_01875 [Blautia obeum]|nr:hypothetical protein [Blautia obeum]